MRVVDPLELVVGSRLAVEELHHWHTGDVLLEEGVDAGDLYPHLAEALAHLGLEPGGQQQQQGDDGERHQGEPPIEPEEDGGDAGEDHDVAEDGHDAGREHLVQGVDVGGHPGHQPADRVAVVEGERQALEMAEDLPPQVLHDVLAHELEDVALGVKGDEGEDQGRQEDEGGDGQPGHGDPRRIDPSRQELAADEEAGRRDLPRAPLRADEKVERHGRSQRSHELEDGGGQDQCQRAHRHSPVGPDVGQEPAHEAGVVGLAQHLLLVLIVGLAHGGRISGRAFFTFGRPCPSKPHPRPLSRGEHRR